MTPPPARMAAADSWQDYRYLADNAIDVVFEADLQTVIHWVSPSVEYVLGWAPEDFVGRSAPTLVHPDDLDEVIALATAINDQAARVHTARVRMLMAAGGYKALQLRGRPALSPDGTVVGHIITMQDTTERDDALRGLAVLSEGNRVLARVEDESALLQEMCEAIVAAGRYPLAWYAARVDDPGHSVARRACAGPSRGYVDEIDVTWGDDPLGGGPTGTALRTGTTQVRDDYSADPDFAPWQDAARRAGLASSISIPVVVDGVIDGALVVAAEDPRSFDERSTELLETLAADLGLGLHRLRTAAALQEQESRLRGLFDSQFDPFVLLEAIRDETGELTDLRYVAVSDAALTFNKLAREQMVGHTITELFPGQVTDGSLAGYFSVIETGVPIVLDDFDYFHEPRQERVRLDIRAVKSGDGVAITFRDVTGRFEAARRLAESEARYRLLAENASDLVWQTDGAGSIVWVSESCRAVLGRDPQELLGHGADLAHPDDAARVREARAAMAQGLPAEGELRLQRADGSWRWMAFTGQRVDGADEATHVIALRDIDAEVRARDELVHVIGHDPLTGLPARSAMLDRITDTFASLRGQELAAVLCVGIDRLSSINDAYTHTAGDIVLTTIATRIVEAVGSAELVGRGAGVEFLVVVPRLATGDEATTSAERIRQAARGPITVAEGEVEVTVSIGIAIGDRRSDAERVVRDSSVAMGQAKAEGRDRLAFADAALAEQARRRLDVEGRIREGLATSRFVPHFQPVVDLATGQLDGYEALVRYLRPDGSIAPPARFMPVAELSPLVADIDMMMLRQCVDALSTIPEPLSVAVNLSTVTLTRPGYPQLIEQVLRESGQRLSRLHLEVTETALLGEVGQVVEVMSTLAALGARWYVDDFGTGYSSISHLRDLPISGLKLDVSFSAGIRSGDHKSVRLAQALAGLAGGLGLDTVAEGIETEQEAQTLLLQGWRHGQGWLYGRPAALP